MRGGNGHRHAIRGIIAFNFVIVEKRSNTSESTFAAKLPLENPLPHPLSKNTDRQYQRIQLFSRRIKIPGIHTDWGWAIEPTLPLYIFQALVDPCSFLSVCVLHSGQKTLYKFSVQKCTPVFPFMLCPFTMSQVVGLLLSRCVSVGLREMGQGNDT